MAQDRKKMLKIGDKVLYDPGYEGSNLERGIVKSFHNDPNFVFVVYNCGGDWENFKDYTAAKTHVDMLTVGWQQ